jgi:D-ribose pyranase
MRRQSDALLHPELAAVIAGLGHGDTLVVADAGLPIPPLVRRIDLAVRCGVPSFADVLGAIAIDLVVERVVVAVESAEAAGGRLRTTLSGALGSIPIDAIAHEELKRRTRDAAAVVRTGECTPYQNAILVCGVAF